MLQTETALVADRKQTGLRLTTEFYQQLSHVAVDRGVSLNELIEVALIDWYSRQPETARYGKAAPYQPSKRGPKPKADD